jgi:uncharacterized protein (DUF952 family)
VSAMTEQADLIYKILSVADWEAAKLAGRFEGSADDRRDGFIHFSDGETVIGTARKYFAGQSGLVLLAVDPARLADLRWERSRDDALFPHLYGPLDLDAVTQADRLPTDLDASDAIADLLNRLTRFALLAVIRPSARVVVALGATGPIDVALGAPRPERAGSRTVSGPHKAPTRGGRTVSGSAAAAVSPRRPA